MVTVRLRKGGGFREPAVQYVRCDDRDCQYVDLNEPPCPLRRDMFGHGNAEHVAALLETRAGEHLCYVCIADALSFSHDDVRRAARRLEEARAVTVGPRTCAACRQRRVGLMAVGGAVAGLAADRHHSTNTPQGRGLDPRRGAAEIKPNPTPEAHERILAFLAKSSGAALCAGCLALSTRLALVEVRDVIGGRDVVGLGRRENACSACGRWQTVISVTTHSDHTAELNSAQTANR